MMKKYQKTITVYELDGGFFVEVNKDEDVTHFYLGHKQYGIKVCMFGACDFYGMTEEELVLANVAEHIALYKEDYQWSFIRHRYCPKHWQLEQKFGCRIL